MLSTSHTQLRLPEQFRKNLGSTQNRREVYEVLRKAKLNTVCEEARCPNIAECFSAKTATFMILGDRCTRRCHFCSVTTAKPSMPAQDEPYNLVEAIKSLGLDYVVITSVDRDDLPDLGASHFAKCIAAIRQELPHVTIELLTPDFKGRQDLIAQVIEAGTHVFGHNIETVQRLYRQVRPQSKFEVTTSVLQYVASTKKVVTKSGMMVGLGESDEEVAQILQLLHDLGVEIVTIGQYLRPSIKHWQVQRYVDVETYRSWVALGKQMGLKEIYAGPFVRSSYHAKEAHERAVG